uniref:GST C-terminal domain-containing protein n=1 Tax=Chromera velia CCMP2878 TaxID=1169474 RepID=A0A0G4F320_9ALVE|eukprot:Cvel_14839.t1-p1 / transcript=Cvel_14839.t1 / gene=Cvel_14839 / organism=Chromera_velia_CCMP2878 / gene_product=Probable glutathione S-transferase 7, putative / transcript_product=Probable glutathione S-transferase 7, putative / location=Cvel_scaffold1071:50495-55857(+) / protein_length=416 / sequence_SO=supercontig / SO=protein_coding / is_pseudo=false
MSSPEPAPAMVPGSPLPEVPLPGSGALGPQQLPPTMPGGLPPFRPFMPPGPPMMPPGTMGTMGSLPPPPMGQPGAFPPMPPMPMGSRPPFMASATYMPRPMGPPPEMKPAETKEGEMPSFMATMPPGVRSLARSPPLPVAALSCPPPPMTSTTTLKEEGLPPPAIPMPPPSTMTIRAPPMGPSYLPPMVSQIPPGVEIVRNLGEITYKYFDIGGGVIGRDLAKMVLLVFCIKHEDERYEMGSEEWTDTKEAIMSTGQNVDGQLPLMIVEGKNFPESHAMSRFLLRRVGRYGQNPRADFLSDMISDKAYKWQSDWVGARFGSDEMKEAYLAKREDIYAKFNKMLNKTSGKYFCGDEIHMADLAVFGIMWDDTLAHGCEILEKFPEMADFFGEVKKTKNLKEWLEKKSAQHQASLVTY